MSTVPSSLWGCSMSTGANPCSSSAVVVLLNLDTFIRRAGRRRKNLVHAWQKVIALLHFEL